MSLTFAVKLAELFLSIISVQVDLHGDFFVTNGGLNHVYKALQFHFHWGHKENHGSEHLIDGQASPIEVYPIVVASKVPGWCHTPSTSETNAVVSLYLNITIMCRTVVRL